MTIRQPVAAAITFSRIVHSLRCHKTKIEVRGKPRIVERHGKKVKVRRPVHTETVMRCHAPTALRKVIVIEHRDGKAIEVKKVERVERVVLLPKVVNQPKLRVAYGQRATVSGWLLLANGTALAGRTVQILAAPDNGLGRFATAATVITAANGSWSAKLAPGPSRLIEAVYAGDSTTEPVTSGAVTLTVPARIAMSISPRVLPWSATVTIRGQLQGGYVPPDGVALRLLVLYPGRRQGSPLLPLRTDASGAFLIKWSFYSGRGVASYPLWISTTATESDYPFTASAGPRISVTFGRRTPAARRRHKQGTKADPHKRQLAKQRRKR